MDKGQDFPLAAGSVIKQIPKPDTLFSSSRRLRSIEKIERAHHGIQHVLVAERAWGQEVDGSSPHRFHRHRNVAMSSHEDDRI